MMIAEGISGAPASDLTERLVRLAANGRAAQWSAEHDIDWHLDVRPPPWLARDDAAVALSQLYHGEVATARACLALQMEDETRHASVYRRYLDRLGGVAAIDPVLAAAWRGSALGTMVAFHVVVEGEALRIQEGLVRLFRCPLLQQINRRIARDEARHVAFGRLYLGARVAELPSRERREIYRWVKRLWSESATATLRNLQGRGGVARVFLQGWLRCGWARHARTLAAVGLIDPHGMNEGAR
jgi:hypothetical protein